MDFGGQEYTDPHETRRYLNGKGVCFDVFRIINVSGPSMSNIYRYLMNCTDDHEITWNFSTVFIVGRDGSVRERIDKPQTNNWALVRNCVATCLEEVYIVDEDH